MLRQDRPQFSVDQLNQMQRYLGEEMIEDYQEGVLTRREMLKRLLLICGSSTAAAALLVACGASTATAPAPTAAAAAPTAAPPPTAAPAATAAAAPTAAAEPTAAAAAPTAAAEPTAAAAAPTAAAGATAAPAPAKSPLSVAADDPDLTSSDVSIPGDSAVMGYMTRPKAEGSYPGVVVIHENRGLTDHIKDVARRLAKNGYVVVAPDLASRAGGTEKVGATAITGFFAQAKPEDLVSDLNATVTFVSQQAGVIADKFGVMGFCFGGGYTLRLAAANPKIVAAVPYYGPTPDPASQMSATNAAILGQYGATDTRVDSTIPALEAVMQQAGKTYEKRLYEGAGHAFNNDTGANYNETAALAAWKETLAWFEKYLKA